MSVEYQTGMAFIHAFGQSQKQGKQAHGRLRFLVQIAVFGIASRGPLAVEEGRGRHDFDFPIRKAQKFGMADQVMRMHVMGGEG